MGRQTTMTTWYGEVLVRVGTAVGHHFLHYPPPPSTMPLALCVECMNCPGMHAPRSTHITLN